MAQHIDVQVLPGADRPVVAKVATGPGGATTLAREAARLERARHPGVVEVLRADDGRLELAWVGSHTLETTTLSVPAAAGVLAAVAVTVADLHGLGVVHGRLDPSHVILAGDGRPVLCGLRGADPGEPEPGPAEDVAAVGRLIDHLLGPDAEPEPIPDRRWARRPWAGYHRRTLQLLADRATHDDPARRPTARALANAIVEAVPDARLVPRAGPDPADATGSADGGIDPTPGIDPQGIHPPGRLDGVTGEAPETAHPTIGDAGTDGPGPHRPVPPAGDPPPTVPAAPSPTEGTLGGDRTDPAPAASRHDDLLTPEPPGPDPLRAGPFLPASTRPGPPAPAGTGGVSAPSSILGLRIEPTPPPAAGFEETRASTRTSTVTRPGPTGSGRSPASTGRPLLAVLAAVGGLALLTVAGSRLGRDDRATASPGRPVAEHATGDTARPLAPDTVVGTTPPVEPTPVPDDRTEAGPTPDAGLGRTGGSTGDPAPTAGADPARPAPTGTEPTASVHQGALLTRAGERFGVGEPGDEAVVGDWDCDGTATPGLVRPATGEVFLFDRWAEPGRPLTVTAALRVAGARALVADPAVCGGDLLLADGTRLTVRRTAEGWTTGAPR